MHITFLAHSGFLVELEHAVLLFDWWKGELPPLPEDKPVLVLVSHHHEDHFNPAVFSLAQSGRTVRFLLGKDIRLSPANRRRWGVTEEIRALCQCVGGFRTVEPLPGIRVETLPSTDEGVAFLVSTEGRTIYHAGDLHWWHWEGEPDPWNPDMARRFRDFTRPLAGRHIDLAMVPLDSRLGTAEDWGLAYLLELADLDHVLPMHQWGNFAATVRFCEKHPQWASRILEIRREGQTFALNF